MMADGDGSTPPIEEWKRSEKTGREYAAIKGPGGGTVWRQGGESVEDARLRHALNREAKQRQQQSGTPKAKTAPKAKGRKPDQAPDIGAAAHQADQVKQAKGRPTQAQLAAAAELPLSVLGAFVGRGVLQCDYCASTMQANAPAAARDLAQSRNPYLINLLTWWHGLVSTFAGGDGLVMFVAPPLVHHALPAPMAEFVSPFLGVPQRAPAQHAHTHTQPAATGTAPAPPRAPAPPQPPSMPPMTPQEAAIAAQDPALHQAVAAGDPRAQAFLAHVGQLAAQDGTNGNGGPAPQVTGLPDQTPEQLQAERDQLQAQAQRLAQDRDMAAREAARAAAMPAGNIPTYRAPDSLSPAQLRQQQAAAESRSHSGGGIPNYQGGDSAAGTAQAPRTDPADSAGSPLPPEAEPLG